EKDAQLQATFKQANADACSNSRHWLLSTVFQKTALPLLQKPSPLDHPLAVPHLPVHDGDQFGVNLIGYAFAELGIGEDVRMAAHACEAAGIPFCVVDFAPGGNI